MTRAWPDLLAVREGAENARAGRRSSLLLSVSVAMVVCVIGVASAMEVSTIVRAEQRWIDDGAFVFVVEPASTDAGAAIDVRRCDALSQVDGIDAAFSADVTDTTGGPDWAPGTEATVTRVSPGAYDFFCLTPPSRPGVLVSVDSATTSGIGAGEAVRFVMHDRGGSSYPADVVAVLFDGASVAERLSGTYLLPDAISGSSSQCYVRTDPAHADAVKSYVADALTGETDVPPLVIPRLADSAYRTDFADAYESRTLAFGWALGSALLVLLWSTAQWTRRGREAIYATFGVHARARVLMHLAEWGTLSGVGAVWGWATAVCLAIGLGADTRVSLVHITAHAVAALATATGGVVLVALFPARTLLEALKDRS
ncbi:hypothetical protein EDD28_2681 [Salana multivorans]|uniref:FtsX-like permease family protein n=1 Tax=Salana multivorans TaxID=120377 RepID=A0A3N2D0K3_9MICO|nr:hypothetical protein [Salana multivorans]ROR93273.1 hypothetical protein EDD28_2681 [Salana multivorans]